MADKPKITFSTNPNPRNRALIDGSVQIDGYDLEYVGDKYTPGEMHYRFVQGEFDLAEMSTATLMRTKEKGQGFRALPVFFQRGPRQRNIFYCEGKLNHPANSRENRSAVFATARRRSPGRAVFSWMNMTSKPPTWAGSFQEKRFTSATNCR
jgi:hypothetical protein